MREILIFTGSAVVLAGCKAKEYKMLSITSEDLRKAEEMKTDDGTEAYFYFDSSPNKDNKKFYFRKVIYCQRLKNIIN